MKTIGDSFFVAFVDPSKAVQFAVSLQLEMRNAPWPPSLLELPDCLLEIDLNGIVLWRGLRVRVGMHTGSAKVEIDPRTLQVNIFDFVSAVAHCSCWF